MVEACALGCRGCCGEALSRAICASCSFLFLWAKTSHLMAFVSPDRSLHRSATSTQLMKPGIDQNLSCTVVAQACLWFTDYSYMFVCIALPLPIISLASCLRLKMGEQKNVPLKDRQMALALILELALQRGTLQQILEAVLLLLRLSGSTCRYYHRNQMQLKC